MVSTVMLCSRPALLFTRQARSQARPLASERSLLTSEIGLESPFAYLLGPSGPFGSQPFTSQARQLPRAGQRQLGSSSA